MRYLKENERIKEGLERMEGLVDQINKKYYEMEIDKLREELEDTEDFKIHDLVQYVSENDISQNILDDYIYMEWKFFEDEILNEYNIELHQLGRTSSHHISSGFYTRELIGMQGYRAFESERIEVVSVLQEAIIGNHVWGVDAIYNKAGEIDYHEIEDNLGGLSEDKEKKIDNIIRQLEKINKLVLLDILETLESDKVFAEEFAEEKENLERAKEYIKIFKENQIENFKEWLIGSEIEVDIQE